MYYYRVKENSELEEYLTKEEEARQNLLNKASSMAEKLGFLSYDLADNMRLEIIGFSNPLPEADLSKFKKPFMSVYIPRKTTDVHKEMKDFSSNCETFFKFFINNRLNEGDYMLKAIRTNFKPYMIGVSHRLKIKWWDQLDEITRSEYEWIEATKGVICDDKD